MSRVGSPTIKDLPATEGRGERLARSGEAALSTTELLAVIRLTGVGGESALAMVRGLLFNYEGLSRLAPASFAELRAERGLGIAKTAPLKAALELGRCMLLATPESGSSSGPRTTWRSS